MKLVINRNFKSLLLFILTLFVITSNSFVYAKQEEGKLRKISKKIDKNLKVLYGKTHNVVDKVLNFAIKKVNKRDFGNIELISSFYDDKIDRTFINLKGTFSSKVNPFFLDIDIEDKYIHNSGSIAFDLVVHKFKIDKEKKTLKFDFNLDLVISYDTLVREIVTNITEMAAASAISYGVGQFTEFLDKFPSEQIATDFTNAVNQTFVKTNTQLTSDSINKILKFKPDFSSINFFSTFSFGILVSGTQNFTSFGFTSLGAAIGTALVPGVGTVIGSMVGKMVYKLFGKVVIRKVTDLFTISLRLKKIIKYSKYLEKSPNEEYFNKQKTTCNNLMYKLKAEMDKDEYHTFEEVVKVIKDKYSKEEILYLKPFLSKMVAYLQFKVLQEQDWYGAKFYNILRYEIQQKGLLKEFNM